MRRVLARLSRNGPTGQANRVGRISPTDGSTTGSQRVGAKYPFGPEKGMKMDEGQSDDVLSMGANDRKHPMGIYFVRGLPYHFAPYCTSFVQRALAA